MEITIDTQKDSKEHLRHLIQLLQTLVGEGEIHSNVPIANIFDQPDTAPMEGSALASLFEEKEVEAPKKDPEPKVQMY